MDQVAPDVWRISLAPRHLLNAYLVGDVVIDAGLAQSAKRVVDAVRAHPVSAHALTHAHQDHAGGSRRVCDTLGIPCWAPADDAAAVEAGQAQPAASPIQPLLRRVSRFAAVPVARRLREGDEVGGLRVVDAPGHSAGHVALWREADRVLVAGDAFFNVNLATTAPGLRQPPRPFTVDPARNRDSMRKLAALEPSVVVFGHGPPLHDAAPALRAFVDRLPA